MSVKGHASPGSDRRPVRGSRRELIEQRPPSELRPHQQSRLIPAIGRQNFAAFRDDVARRGVLVPLEITEASVVLDGHLRLRAALELALEAVPVRLVDPPDELEYLLLAALQRRQLEVGQRAALVLELDQFQQARERAAERQRANLKQNQTSEVAVLPPRGKSRDLAAELAGVSARTIQHVATVRAGDPELFEQIKQGTIAPDRAARQLKQRQRDAQLGPTPPLPDGHFDLIYADPPWRLPGSPDSNRAVENHYPTMTLDEIKALRVPAADDAILFLWGVNSMTPAAIEVMATWGFDYITNFAWVKHKWGLGHYNRCQHELLHVGRRGNVTPPPTDKRPSSVINAKQTRHSAKPSGVYELLETMYPSARRLELFARTSRPGWTAWGNQAAAEAPK